MSWIDKILGRTIRTKEEVINEFESSMQQYNEATASVVSQTEKDEHGVSITKREEGDEDEDLKSLIEFIIAKDSQLSVNIKWNDGDEDTAESLGHLLWHINNGSFEENCSQILTSIAVQNPEARGFVNQVFKSWKQKSDHTPLMKPSQVFGSEGRAGPGRKE